MAHQNWMKRFARWHIWLGWLVGVPIVMWTATGLFMVAKPIDEVRGSHLKVERAEQALPPGNPVPVLNEIDAVPTVKEIRTVMQYGRAVTFVTRLDGSISRFDAATGEALPVINEAQAREIVAREIIGGDKVATSQFFTADTVPFDFRRPMPVWQIALQDGSYVYVGQETGAIESVRTRWWRIFDVMWGLHIMDLEGREDSSHPILILFTALALIGSIIGCTLMFRRRKSLPKVRVHAG